MRFTKPSYFYHLTSRKLGLEVSLHPLTLSELTSIGNLKINRAEEEPDVKKICVAPAIPNCLSALPLDDRRLYVLRTKNKVKAAIPWGVADQRITQERWIVRCTKFIRIGVLTQQMRGCLSQYLKKQNLPTYLFFPGEPEGESLQIQTDIAHAICQWWKKYGEEEFKRQNCIV